MGLSARSSNHRPAPGSRAAIDNEILGDRRIQAVLAIREQLGCGIHEAVDIINDRFLILNQFCSADFTMDTET